MDTTYAGQAVIANPYVTQIEKLSNSLEALSNTFLKFENSKQTFSKEEIQEMFGEIEERVCKKCEKCSWCMGDNYIHTYQLVYQILHAVEEYGIELNVETKRKLQKCCINAPRFLRETLDVFHDAKQNLLWTNRMIQNREGCAEQLDTFAQMIKMTTLELEASIFQDPALERRLKTRLKRVGIRVLSCVFFVTREGQYEMHITAKCVQGICVTTAEMVKIISEVVGRKMILGTAERPLLSQEYATIVCMEGPKYHTIQGVAKIGKDGNKISGDSFSMMKLPGGQEAAVLSDGMGAGERAFKESSMVIELLEELLGSGFPIDTAIQMMNTALVMGREEIRFSTVDMSVFDLYNGKCEIVKVGASTTFVKSQNKVERITSASLPIGVLNRLEIETIRRDLKNGDFVIMVTDGVMDALPVGEQDLLMETIVGGCIMHNPKEMAHHILEQVLEWNGMEPQDDMTVLVIGIWQR
ncbi:SpoIIE family protein phosphatase [Lachnospiraceae bacterium LCP25S3_G4]